MEYIDIFEIHTVAYLLGGMYQAARGAAGWWQSSWLTTDLEWQSFCSVSIFPRLGSLWSLTLMLKFFLILSIHVALNSDKHTHTHKGLFFVGWGQVAEHKRGSFDCHVLLYCIPVYFIQAKFTSIGVENLFKWAWAWVSNLFKI